MRLLVVSQYFWPENFRINDLVDALVQRGHEVTVLTGYPNYPEGEIFPQFLAEPICFAEYEGAQIVRVPLIARGCASAWRLVLNYASFAISACTVGLWRLRGRKFDAIFVYEPSPVTVGLPALALRVLKRAPVAFWVLDLWPQTLQALGVVRAPLLLRAVGALVSFIYRRCDVILAQSKSFIPHIQQYAGPNARVLYFPSWAEQVFDIRHVQPASEVVLPSKSFNVMFAGNIGQAQDFPAILAAAEMLRAQHNIHWLFVGDGRMASWVQEEIVRRGLQDCVHMLGRYPVQRMPEFFKHAHVLLLSLKDKPVFALTIPGKLQSYLAAGVPIVAMLNGEGAQVVRDAGAGLTCAAGDSEALAAAVKELSELPVAELQAMGARALALSAQEFDRQRLIDQLEQLLLGLRIQPLKLPPVQQESAP